MKHSASLSVARLVAAAAAITSPCLAQVVVDPGGGGHFTDLQTAINTVAPGSVLQVRGGTFGPLTIPKSLTIVGDPETTITSPNTFGTPILPSAIRLQGSGNDRLVLSGVTISGEINGIWYGAGDAAISGAGFAEVRIHDSRIHAPSWFYLTGNATGVPAITLPSATVVIARSEVRSSDSENDSLGFVADGVHGVLAERVIALQSHIMGGGCGRSLLGFGPPEPTPCPCATGSGIGGPGIDASDVFDAASIIEGGAGSEVVVSFGPFVGPVFAWGRQPNGPAVAPGTVRNQMPADLFMLEPPRIGTMLLVNFNRGFPDAGALGLGAMTTTPFPFSGGRFFLDPLALYTVLPIPPFSMALSIPIPSVRSLGGADLSMQALWLNGTLSNPVTGIIRY